MTIFLSFTIHTIHVTCANHSVTGSASRYLSCTSRVTFVVSQCLLINRAQFGRHQTSYFGLEWDSEEDSDAFGSSPPSGSGFHPHPHGLVTYKGRRGKKLRKNMQPGRPERRMCSTESLKTNNEDRQLDQRAILYIKGTSMVQRTWPRIPP
jgi:hypothetical protein